ncbi:MAG: hypothetical protein AAGC55_31580 [Myxococcota bacterium]
MHVTTIPVRPGALALVLGVMTLGALGACSEQSVCADVFSNATVTDVTYDQTDNTAQVSLFHRLSYCTGTDDKRYAIEQLVIDLGAAALTTQHRTADSLDLFPPPERAVYIYRDGGFTNSDYCAGCELVLTIRDTDYALHFVTAGPDQVAAAMTLSLMDGGAETLAVDIGGFESVQSDPAGAR